MNEQTFTKSTAWIIGLLALLLLLFGVYREAKADTIIIDMEKIKRIESSGCREKIGRFEHARGCWQITAAALADWNNAHPDQSHLMEDMLDDDQCLKVADWYMNVQIPRYLISYKIADTVANRLIAYNAGIGKLVKKEPLSKYTIRYLAKYDN